MDHLISYSPIDNIQVISDSYRYNYLCNKHLYAYICRGTCVYISVR